MNCVSCRALILEGEPTESCDHGLKCESCMDVACPECDQEATAMEPDHDDSVKCCPDCERPNQFGEQCESCRQEEQAELAIEVDAPTREDALLIACKAVLLIPQEDGIQCVKFDHETVAGTAYLTGRES